MSILTRTLKTDPLPHPEDDPEVVEARAAVAGAGRAVEDARARLDALPRQRAADGDEAVALEVELEWPEAQTALRRAEAALARARRDARAALDQAIQRARPAFEAKYRALLGALDIALGRAAEANEGARALWQEAYEHGVLMDPIFWPELLAATATVETKLSFWRRRLEADGWLTTA